jgi:hypothetical protein
MAAVEQCNKGSSFAARIQCDGSMPQPSSNELIERVRKLRWIGLEDEARQMAMTLPRLADSDTVLSAPRDTD